MRNAHNTMELALINQDEQTESVSQLRQTTHVLQEKLRDQQQVLQGLQRHQECYETAKVVGQFAAWSWDIQVGQIVFDPALLELLGYSNAIAMVDAIHWPDLIEPTDWQRMMQAAVDYLAGRSDTYEMESRFRHQHGRWHWFLIRGVANPSSQHQLVGTAIDITVTKLAPDPLTTNVQNFAPSHILEQQVRERTTLLQQALNFEAVLKRITDKVRDNLDEAHIIQTAVRELAIALKAGCCNAALYDLQQQTSTIFYEYSPVLPAYQGRVAHMSNAPELYDQLQAGQYFQFCSMTPNPVRGRVSMLACPMLDNKGVLGDLWLINQVGYAFSELEIRLVQQVANQCAIALRQARLYHAAQMQVEELERLNQLKDDFLSTVSHELRTPMTNMKMAIQMLSVTLKQAHLPEQEPEDLNRAARSIPPTSSNPDVRLTVSSFNKALSYLNILNVECEQEISLINDLLDLQRLDAGRHVLVRQPIRLQDWLPKLAVPFQSRMQNRQQQFQLEIPSHLPTIISDPSTLGRILAELINNACKYTPPLETIKVQATVLAECLVIHVINTGVEIPKDELSCIFDKFYRIPNNDPWKQSGTGLGLALVKSLTNYLGGVVNVRSASTETCFTLELPLVQADERSEQTLSNVLIE